MIARSADRGTGTAIEFRDVTVAFGGRRILGPLSLRVRRGERLVLLGESGSGKTTTLKLINRLLDPAAGEVRVDGLPTTGGDPVVLRRRIGYVIQEIGLFPHFTVARNVGLVPSLSGWEKPRIEGRVRELLELVGLSAAEYPERYPAELSGGQRQRVGLARALAADPPMLLCDEPFGALDRPTRRQLQREFKSLVERLDKTVVFVTHDVEEALFLGERIAVLAEGGTLAFHGTREEFERDGSPAVEALKASL